MFFFSPFKNICIFNNIIPHSICIPTRPKRRDSACVTAAVLELHTMSRHVPRFVCSRNHSGRSVSASQGELRGGRGAAPPDHCQCPTKSNHLEMQKKISLLAHPPSSDILV